MTYLYLLSLLTLVAYIGYALKVFGLPASLSDTYYILKDKHRPSWLFQLAMVLCPMLLVPVWLELSSDSVQFLSFLACGGLMFVGTAPLFKEDYLLSPTEEDMVKFRATLEKAGSGFRDKILEIMKKNSYEFEF